MIDLQQAEEAERQLGELQAAASAAPLLRQQQAQQRAADEHRRRFSQAEAAAKACVQKAILDVPEQRARFMAWAQSGLELARESGKTQTELLEVLGTLAGFVRTGLGTAANEGQKILLDGQVHSQATPIFQRIGAMDPKLELFPPKTGAHVFAVACLDLMGEYVQSVYLPARGAQQFWKTRLTSMLENRKRHQ